MFTTAAEYPQDLQLILNESPVIMATNSERVQTSSKYFCNFLITLSSHLFQFKETFLIYKRIWTFLIEPQNVNKSNPCHRKLQYGKDHIFVYCNFLIHNSS